MPTWIAPKLPPPAKTKAVFGLMGVEGWCIDVTFNYRQPTKGSLPREVISAKISANQSRSPARLLANGKPIISQMIVTAFRAMRKLRRQLADRFREPSGRAPESPDPDARRDAPLPSNPAP